MRKVVIIVLTALVGLVFLILLTSWVATYFFNQKVEGEVAEFFKGVRPAKKVIEKADIEKLPPPVQKWLINSGMVGKEWISTVRLKQKAVMRSDPNGAWMRSEAEQYFTADKPGFIWKAWVEAFPLVRIVARDKYENGSGNMLIKLMALFTIADSKGKEMDQGTMLRYLAEVGWFPSAALCDHIKWEPIDSLSARATMAYGSVTASGIYRFNESGDVVNFEAQRYGEFNGKFSLETWSIATTGWKTFEGIRIAASSEVTWKLKSGDFTWLRLELTDVQYNKLTMYE